MFIQLKIVALVVAMSSFAMGAVSSAKADQPDETAVKAVLASYNAATQKLDVSGTRELFSSDSEIIESGGVEGTFDHYLEHHIGPELKEFKSFAFSDYKVNVTIDGAFAFATESFRFRIEPKEGAAVERQAVATSVLRRGAQGWKIYRYHWSSRRIEPAKP